MERLEVRIGGLGGQGVVTAAFVLGQAACLFDQKNSTQTQSYGPEARGGFCRSEVVISDEEIDYPKVTKPNIFVAMSQEAYNQYGKDIKKDGLLIIDSDLVKLNTVDPTIKVYKIPGTRTAEAVIGNEIVANVVMLGALTVIANIVSPTSMEESIKKRWPRFAELNIKAFHHGIELGNVAMSKIDEGKD